MHAWARSIIRWKSLHSFLVKEKLGSSSGRIREEKNGGAIKSELKTVSIN